MEPNFGQQKEGQFIPPLQHRIDLELQHDVTAMSTDTKAIPDLLSLDDPRLEEKLFGELFMAEEPSALQKQIPSDLGMVNFAGHQLSASDPYQAIPPIDIEIKPSSNVLVVLSEQFRGVSDPLPTPSLAPQPCPPDSCRLPQPTAPAPPSRPVRQSRLKRTFNIVDLEKDGIDDEILYTNDPKDFARKESGSAQKKGPTKRTQSGRMRQRMHNQNSIMYTSQSELGIRDLVDKQQSLVLGCSGDSSSQAITMSHLSNDTTPRALTQLPHPTRSNEFLSVAPPLPLLPCPPDIIECPLDIECPRRSRSDIPRRPKTSRASINRLKQAAHGTLPLGVSSNRSTAIALLNGGGSVIEDDVDVDADNLPRRQSSQGDAEDNRSERYNQRRMKRRTSSGRIRIPEGNNNNQVPKRQETSTTRLTDNSSAHKTGFDSMDSQLKATGPTEEQRKLIEQIAAAPPDQRQAMIQQLMKQKLGIEEKPKVPTELGSLPRHEQQVIAGKLMSQMTPRQRHTLAQMKTSQQAAILQEFYSRYIYPGLLQHHHQQQQEQSNDVANSLPMTANTIPSSKTPATGGDDKSPSMQTTDKKGKGPVVMHRLLQDLKPEVALNVASMPAKEQQLFLLKLLQQKQYQSYMDRIDQKSHDFGMNNNVLNTCGHKGSIDGMRAPLIFVGSNPQQTHPVVQSNQLIHNAQSLSNLGGTMGAQAVFVPGSRDVTNAHAINTVRAGDGMMAGTVPDNDPLHLMDPGMEKLLEPALDDAEALQDAMNFFLR